MISYCFVHVSWEDARVFVMKRMSLVAGNLNTQRSYFYIEVVGRRGKRKKKVEGKAGSVDLYILNLKLDIWSESVAL